MQALVKLLGDPGERTVRMVRERLLQAGPAALPWVARAASSEPDPVVRGRARLLLEEMRFAELQRRLAQLASRSDAEFDLEEGLFVVARARYPELSEEPYRLRLADMASELARRQIARMSPGEAAAAVNRYLFVEQAFRSNEAHYYDPDNVCINQVLDRRMGISISLAALYLLVARRAGFSVHGVSLPGRFVIGIPAPAPLWVDPSRGGRALSRHDLVAIAREAGHQFDESMLAPVSAREMVARMLAHLMRVYALTSQAVSAQRLEQLLKIVNRRGAPPDQGPASSSSRPSSASSEGRPV